MDWSYVAGFFDGEGNLKVNKIVKNGVIHTYQIAIRIYNSDLDLLNKIKDFIGYGAIYSNKRANKTEVVHEFTITKKSHVAEVLQRLGEHSQGKKEKIDFLLKNFDFSRNNNSSFNLDEFHKMTERKNVATFYRETPFKEIG